MLFETDEALIVMFLGIILFFAKKIPGFRMSAGFGHTFTNNLVYDVKTVKLKWKGEKMTPREGKVYRVIGILLFVTGVICLIGNLMK